MNKTELKTCMLDLVDLAKQTGQIAMNSYGKVKSIKKEVKNEDLISEEQRSEKQAFSLMDLKCQNMVTNHVSVKYPEFGMFLEEVFDEQDIEDAKKKGQTELVDLILTSQSHIKRLPYINQLPEDQNTVLVDPIDGSKNYLTGKSDFAVCITLFNGKDPLGTVFYFPKLEKSIYSIKDLGTFINGKKIQITKFNEFSQKDLIRIGSYLKKSNPQIEPNFNIPTFGSSCGNMRATIEQQVKAYITNRVGLLDFSGTAFAYKNAGGLFLNKDLEPISTRDIISEDLKFVQGLMFLVPSKEYVEGILSYMESKNISFK
tara:strand:- start:2794 stop:3738 length:945 start_codon:yes stop_codon:yes gene_type:complete